MCLFHIKLLEDVFRTGCSSSWPTYAWWRAGGHCDDQYTEQYFEHQLPIEWKTSHWIVSSSSRVIFLTKNLFMIGKHLDNRVFLLFLYTSKLCILFENLMWVSTIWSVKDHWYLLLWIWYRSLQHHQFILPSNLESVGIKDQSNSMKSKH